MPLADSIFGPIGSLHSKCPKMGTKNGANFVNNWTSLINGGL
jgi:hypothetical protein